MKKPLRILTTTPWAIVEDGFHADYNEVAESLFSISNEFMGVRGHFEEGYSGMSLCGNFFNGVFEKEPISYPRFFPGNPTHTTPVANATDWLTCSVIVDGRSLDLASAEIESFRRTLDFRTGVLTRHFTLKTEVAELEFEFERMLSMVHPHFGLQRVTVRCRKGCPNITLRPGLRGGVVHRTAGRSFWRTVCVTASMNRAVLCCRTHNSGIGLCSESSLWLGGDASLQVRAVQENAFAGQVVAATLAEGKFLRIERTVCHAVDRSCKASDAKLVQRARTELKAHTEPSFDEWVESNRSFWDGV